MILNIHVRVAIHFPNTKNSQEEQINFFVFYLRKEKKKKLFLSPSVFLFYYFMDFVQVMSKETIFLFAKQVSKKSIQGFS